MNDINIIIARPIVQILFYVIVFIFILCCGSCNKDNDENNSPTASFIVTPSSGYTTLTLFKLDPRESFEEGDYSPRQFRWDFENDGIWDTGWIYPMFMYHQYNFEGLYIIKMEIKNSEGLTNSTIRSVTVENFPGIETMTDPRDGQTYNIITIGSQTWMAENLNFETEDSYCYDNDNLICDKYGRLYKWDTALTICPPGWHLPSDDEWKLIEGTVDSHYGVGDPEWDKEDNRGYDAGYQLRSQFGWSNVNHRGIDAFGFTVLPGGYLFLGGDSFREIFNQACFWTSSGDNYHLPWIRRFSAGQTISRTEEIPSMGYSVRCVKD